MKLIILAGGLKSVLSDNQEGIPKPMLEIGGKPLLWHIMKNASNYGIKEFIVCGGYKIELIKQYFMDFYVYQSDIMIDLKNNQIQVLRNKTEDWKVTVVDTGINTSQPQRIAQIEEYIEDENFLVAYGDCLTDIALDELVETHIREQRIITMAIAHPSGRKSTLEIDCDGLLKGYENDQGIEGSWTNAGVFAMRKDVFPHLRTDFEMNELMAQRISKDEQIMTFRHTGFWIPLETVRDKVVAEQIWESGNVPWNQESV
ncbi:MAG: NTP transferase domain-containing protein [Clostridiales bacterium]|nr:NTP transferase domain-containing protein [Clostridiales bacterium]